MAVDIKISYKKKTLYYIAFTKTAITQRSVSLNSVTSFKTDLTAFDFVIIDYILNAIK